MLRKITCNRTRKLVVIKEKSFFISIRLHSVTISGYILEAHSTSKSLKKNKKQKRMEGVCAEEKEKGRMRRGKKKEKRKERMKGRRRKGKRWKRGEEEKGWKEFVRREREKGE